MCTRDKSSEYEQGTARECAGFALRQPDAKHHRHPGQNIPKAQVQLRDIAPHPAVGGFGVYAARTLQDEPWELPRTLRRQCAFAHRLPIGQQAARHMLVPFANQFPIAGTRGKNPSRLRSISATGRNQRKYEDPGPSEESNLGTSLPPLPTKEDAPSLRVFRCCQVSHVLWKLSALPMTTGQWVRVPPLPPVLAEHVPASHGFP